MTRIAHVEFDSDIMLFPEAKGSELFRVIPHYFVTRVCYLHDVIIREKLSRKCPGVGSARDNRAIEGTRLVVNCATNEQIG